MLDAIALAVGYFVLAFWAGVAVVTVMGAVLYRRGARGSRSGSPSALATQGKRAAPAHADPGDENDAAPNGEGRVTYLTLEEVIR